MTTSRLKLKTTLALPTVACPVRFTARGQPLGRARRRPRSRPFLAEDTLWLLTMLVSTLGVIGCLIWVWL